MNRGPIILAVVSALFLGAALGFMGGVLFTKHHFGEGRGRMASRMHGPGRPGRPGDVRVMPSANVLLPWLERELDLSAEQLGAIRAEIAKSREDMAGVHDSLHTRVARHLTPQQRERFERLVKDRFPGDPRGRGPHRLRRSPGEKGDPK